MKQSENVGFAELPEVLTLRNKGDRTRVSELLAELEQHTFCLDESGQEVKREQRVEAIKIELGEIQAKHGLPGVRCGRLCFVAQEISGRKTLDKGLLMENLGLTMDQIESCSREGKAYWRQTFKRLEEE
jgi:hypothetical protein